MTQLAAVFAFSAVLCLVLSFRAAEKARQERAARLIGRVPPPAPVARVRRRADPEKMKRDLVVGVLGAVAAFGVMMAVVGSLPLALCAMLVGVFAPRWYEVRRRAARESAFARQLEGAVMVMSSVLRAGGSLEQAMARVAERYKEPLGPEFERALKEARSGRPAAEALAAIEERMPVPEMGILSVAVQVCARTGGDLASLMDRAGEAVRARRQVAQTFRAFSAQGRMQTMVIGVMPLVLIGLFRLVMPSMMDPLLHTPWGQTMLYVCFGWIALGWWVVSRMVAPPKGVES